MVQRSNDPPQPSHSPAYVLSTSIGIILGCLALTIAFFNFTTSVEGAHTLWAAGLAGFILADLLYGVPKHHLLLGYLNFGILWAWLLLGGLPALAVIGSGVIAANVIRFALRARYPSELQTLSDYLRFALWRAATACASLLIAMVCFALLGGKFPLTSLPEYAAPLLISVLAAWVASQWLGWRLLNNSAIALMWSRASRPYLTGEVINVLLVLVMPSFLFSMGQNVFLLVLLITALQAIRYRELRVTRERLMAHAAELSLFSNVRQRITDTLVIDDLLWSIYHEVQQLIPSKVFIAALYDADSQIIDFRLVVEDGQRVQKLTRPLYNSPIDQVIRTKRPVSVTASEADTQVNGYNDDYTRFAAYLGVPLMVGDKIIGALAIIEHDEDSIYAAREIEILQSVAGQVALAIRNATLFDRSTKLTESLALINSSVQNVMFNLDNAKGMGIACNTARYIADAQKAAIYLLDVKDKKDLQLVQQTGLPEEFLAAYSTISYHADLFVSGAQVVNKIGSGSPFFEQAQAGEFQACAFIPLRSSSAMVGSIAVYHDDPHIYRKSELDLLETLANQITAALDNAELLKALEVYASEQAQLVYLSRMSGSSLELNTVLLSIASLLEQMLNVDKVLVVLRVPGRERLQCIDTSGDTLKIETLPSSPFIELERFKGGEQDIAPQIFHIDQPVLSSTLREIMQRSIQGSALLMPLFTNNSLLGALLLGSEERRDFTESEMRLIEMAMSQIAAQIYNARLYTSTEDDLKKQLDQLSMLENIAQQITGELDLNQLIVHVMQAAITATQADVATLGLLTEGDDFWFIVREQDANGSWKQTYLTSPNNMGTSGRVARSGQPLLIRDNRLESDYVPPSKTCEYLSSLVVPLRKEERIIGVLNVESKSLDAFTPEQATFLNNLAGHAVICISNARLLQERQQEIETLTRLRELSLRMSSAHDIPSVATAILQTCFSMLGAQDAAIYSYNSITDDFTLLAGMRYDTTRRLELEETLITGELAARVIREGSMSLIEDLRQYPPYEFVDTREYITLMGVPIKRGRQVREVLCFGFNSLQRFEERDQSAIELLSIQAAGHLENAMLNEAIRSSSNRTRAILDSARDGVILLDPRGLLIDYNPSAERLLGVNLEDRENVRFAETLMNQIQSGEAGEGGYSPTEIADLVRVLQEEPERITRRQFIRFTHGQYIHIEEIGSPVTDANHLIIGRLLVLRDITEEKLLEAYREDITHMIVHDLRAPLGSIISALTLAMESVSDPSTVYMVGTTLDVSLTSAYKLLRLVDSLLDIARLEKRQMPLKFARAQVGMMITEANDTLISSVSAANITVQTQVADGLPDVWVDVDKIQRVIVNLLDNAIRYTPTNGTVLISAALTENQKKMQVLIADSGSGIPLEERERIFDKFTTQVKKGPIRGPKGSGLGLTFCKLAVEAHGERIWVEEKGPLSGACFIFTLPLIPDNAPVNTTQEMDESYIPDIIT